MLIEINKRVTVHCYYFRALRRLARSRNFALCRVSHVTVERNSCFLSSSP